MKGGGRGGGGGGRFGGMRYGLPPKGDNHHDDGLEGRMSQEALAKYSEELSARRSLYSRCFLVAEVVDIIVLGLLEIVWHGSLRAWFHLDVATAYNPSLSTVDIWLLCAVRFIAAATCSASQRKLELTNSFCGFCIAFILFKAALMPRMQELSLMGLLGFELLVCLVDIVLINRLQNTLGVVAVIEHVQEFHNSLLNNAENGNADGALEEAEPQYRFEGLGLWETLKVLKPYFWPTTPATATGEDVTHKVFINRCRAVGTWFCVILSKICNVISPLYLAYATNELTALLSSKSPELSSSLIWYIVLYALLTALSKSLKEAQSLMYISVQQSAYVEIANLTFKHLHELSLDWHIRKKTGNTVRSFTRGVQAAQMMMQYLFLYLVPTLAECVAVTLIFTIHFNNARLAATCLLALGVYIYITVKVTIWRKKFREGTMVHDNELHDRLNDSLTNYETIKYFGNEDYELMEFTKAVSQFQAYSMMTQASLSILNVAQVFVICATTIVSLLLMADESLVDHADIGAFVAVNAYVLNLFAPLSWLGTIYNMVINSIIDMQSFGQLLKEPHDVKDKAGAIELRIQPNTVQNLVVFDHVYFKYRRQPYSRSLRDCSFVVPENTTTAIVGVTGSGKTTVSRLLFRFFDVDDGAVRVGGYDVRDVTQKSLRAQIGCVPQDVVLFNDTIIHNIRYGRLDATDEECWEVARKAKLDQLIEQQLDGMNTVVGERGLKLSGGEKQRLAIARCMLKDTPILLLDEATSALDSATEQAVQTALANLRENRTTIVIAHRLSTIRHANQIVVLEFGKLVEKGAHEDLIKIPNGKYRDLWEKQQRGIDVDLHSTSGPLVFMSLFGNGSLEGAAASIPPAEHVQITGIVLTNGNRAAIPRRSDNMMLLLLPWTIALGCTLLLLLTLPSVRHKLLQKLVYTYICLWYLCRRMKKLLGLGKARRGGDATAGGSDALASARCFASRALGPAFKPEKPKPLLLDRTTDLPPLQSPVTWNYLYREDDVREIRSALEATEGRSYGVYGPPGVGKTTVLEKAMEESRYKCIVIDMQRYCHYNFDVFIDELNRTDILSGDDPQAIASYCQSVELPVVILHADLLRRSRWLNNSGRGEAFLRDLRRALQDKGVPLVMESDSLTQLEYCDHSLVIEDPDVSLLAGLYADSIPYFDTLSPVILGRLGHWKDVCGGGDLSSASRVANNCWMTFLAHPDIVCLRDGPRVDYIFTINETVRYLVQLLGSEGASLRSVGPWETLLESNRLVGILVESGVLALLPTSQGEAGFELVMSSGVMSHALRYWLEKAQPDLHWREELRYIRHLFTRERNIREPLRHLASTLPA
ncbi:hypothetical protein FOZ62_029116 [Perkinsus olseni]|uniref:ATP-binding cassette sub- B member 7, mitochondrial n=1 Tax=Perkinsus olseni TaxID=32597 RepID=A0A7J6TTG7_PEROL|nr:hypothetical protein FOZ62_029116 [Perkinsus olseni]